ncbi:MAG: CAP domain-containing protein [Pseudomonadota bacterium]
MQAPSTTATTSGPAPQPGSSTDQGGAATDGSGSGGSSTGGSQGTTPNSGGDNSAGTDGEPSSGGTGTGSGSGSGTGGTGTGGNSGGNGSSGGTGTDGSSGGSGGTGTDGSSGGSGGTGTDGSSGGSGGTGTGGNSGGGTGTGNGGSGNGGGTGTAGNTPSQQFPDDLTKSGPLQPDVANDMTFADLINGVRAGNGAKAVTYNAQLDQAAQGHANDMLAKNYFSHTSADGRTLRDRVDATGYKWSTIGENIAQGHQSEKEVLDAWVASPGHQRNNVNPNFEEFGLGQAGKDFNARWVLVFGAQR